MSGAGRARKDRDPDPDAYLARIGVASGPPAVKRDGLDHLIRAHLLSVPFENLDLLWPRPLDLDPDAFFRKIVGERRGGLCFELNGLFAWLLARLGYAPRLVSGRAVRDGTLAPEFDHLALLVLLDEPYLVDVGFGGAQAHRALPLSGAVGEGPEGRFRVHRAGPDDYALDRRGDEGWETLYRFSTVPRRLEDFGDMFRYHRTSPEAPFARGILCSRPTADGRVTLTAASLIVTGPEGRRRVPVASSEERDRHLRDHFGIRRPEADPGGRAGP